MRKFYALVTGLLFSLVTMKTTAQESPFLNYPAIEPGNIQSPFTVSDERVPGITYFDFSNPDVGSDEDSCRADFEVSHAASSPLVKKFTAIPWHNNQKRPVLICWSFGDGTDTCIQYSNTNPGPFTVEHTYQHDGVYEVCVKILYHGGCEARKCKEIRVGEFCRADFEKILLSPTVNPLYVTFKALPWHSNNKKPHVICWSFGDGRDTCIEYPQNYNGIYVVKHRYREAGNYEVCVKIRYFGGCESGKCKRIQFGKRDTCRADFVRLPLSTINNPLTVNLKALPWHNNNKKPKKICWYFGDGKDTCIEYPVGYTGLYLVRHTYREPGNYNVCIKILYYGGCEAGKCKHLQVGRPDECRADFERLPFVNADHPLVVGFKALPWHNNNKKPKLICWSFGDGQDTCVEYAENFSGPYIIRHRYQQPGVYTVCIKILYYGGCEARKCKEIRIPKPDECRADFEKLALSTVNNPLTVFYKALPRHNNNKKPKTICWKFGDGKDTCIDYPANYTGSYVVRHTYREPGNYEVCVNILYYGGCEARKCKLVQVGHPDECRADFERVPLVNAEHPLLAGFKALPWHNNNKKPKLICWSFGDGRDTCIEYPADYTGQYGVRHEYREPGIYEVCIKILYYGGCEARKCKEIRIGERECRADFERMPLTTNTPLTVGFKALPWHHDNKKPRVICWSFGDGKDTCIEYPENYSGQYYITHTYHHAGEYEVCVKIKYYGGCEAGKCKTIKIEGLPDVCRVKLFEITPSITSLMRGFYAAPWHNNNKRPVLVCWYFGDGTDTCIQVNPANPLPNLFIRHTYPGPGVYRACVKILFQGGCIASDCEEVIIRPVTNVCGGFMTDSITSPRTFKFKGFAIHNPNDPVIGYRWSFGDGTGATGKEVTHTYQHAGTYEVCLTIKTQRGCETRVCKKLTVPGNAQPALQLTPNPVNLELHVLFYSTHTEPVNIKIVNSSGVVVRNFVRNATEGANTWNFDASGLLAGVYTFIVYSPNQLSSGIFIKN